MHMGHEHPDLGHAAMIGAEVPAPGGPHAQDAALFPPKPLPHQPGRVREYDLTALDHSIEVAQGVHFDAWSYNGSVQVSMACSTSGASIYYTSDGSDPTFSSTMYSGPFSLNHSATIKAKAGQTVLVTAVSDAADEVHIHGYDKELPLTPGKPASVKFTADMKGTFEIETHESGKLVAKLVVS